MWIKICANTCLDDALAAAEAGADAVGFVFAPSRRQVTPEQVRRITAALPREVERVGVFAADSLEAIAQAVRMAGLTAVQLHGGLDVPFAARLRGLLGPEISLIHVVHWPVGDHLAATKVAAALQRAEALPDGDRLLLDAKVQGTSGGLGVSYNWQAAARLLPAAAGLPIIMAGGLAPTNVSEAIQALRPCGVDVASGVERAPGQKDHAAVAAFIKNARLAG